MRAVRYERYGPPDVLQFVDVEPPVPEDDEVLVRVRATTVNRTDWGFRQGKPRIVRFFNGLTRPKRPVLGTELSGVVDAVGPAVTQFAVGDGVILALTCLRWARVQKGQRILVYGASGSIGTAAVQLAKRLGPT